MEEKNEMGKRTCSHSSSSSSRLVRRRSSTLALRSRSWDSRGCRARRHSLAHHCCLPCGRGGSRATGTSLDVGCATSLTRAARRLAAAVAHDFAMRFACSEHEVGLDEPPPIFEPVQAGVLVGVAQDLPALVTILCRGQVPLDDGWPALRLWWAAPGRSSLGPWHDEPPPDEVDHRCAALARFSCAAHGPERQRGHRLPLGRGDSPH